MVGIFRGAGSRIIRNISSSLTRSKLLRELLAIEPDNTLAPQSP
jgi:hypothetical protein